MQVLKKGTYQWRAGLRGENFYVDKYNANILTELAQNLQQYTTNYSEALEYLKEYVALSHHNPRDRATAFSITAKISLKRGELEVANNFIDRALQITHVYDDVLLKGDIMMKLKKWAEAKKFYSKAVNMKRTDTEARIALSNAIAMIMDDPCSFGDAEWR